MSRPRKLNDDAEELLKSRIDIARTSQSQILSTNEIADGFEVSVATLRRYYFPQERKLSLTVSTRSYYAKRETATGMCEQCGKSFEGHLRCVDCKILLHEVPTVCKCGDLHGLRMGKHCANCMNWHHRVGR